MTRMKDSGIEWIGEVPEEWRLKPIKYLATYDDSILSQSEINQNITINYVDIGSVNLIEGITNSERFNTLEAPSRARRKTQVGDTIVSTVRTYLKAIAYISNEQNYIVSTGFCVLRPSCIDSRFFSYAVKSDSFTKLVEKYAWGVSYPAISSSQLVNLPIAFPKSLPEQTQIADFLDKKLAQLDKVKSLLEEQINTLEDYRQSLIYETVTKGLDKTVPLKDSGVDWIGQIPEGWGVKRLKNILSDEKDNMKVGPFGSALSGNDIKSFGKKWVYNQRTVLDNNFITTDSFIDDTKWEELKSFSVKAGDVLLTTRGTIGKIAIVPENNQVGIIHPCLIRFRLNEGMLSGELLKYIFNDTDLVKNQLHYLSNSTTIDVIYSYNLKNIFLPVIPESVQNKITDFLKREIARINQMIAIKKEQIENINKQRQTLIYDYVTGKRRV